VQVPAVQVVPLAQTCPQPPQFAESLTVSTHLVPHFTLPPPQTV
jgi:hypothetical protein